MLQTIMIGIPGFDVVSTAVEWKNFVQQVALSTGSDYTVRSSACFLVFYWSRRNLLSFSQPDDIN